MAAPAQPEPQDVAARLKVIYDNYRTFRLNQLYYGTRLDNARRYNKYMEIALIVGTSGGVGSWAVFSTGVGSKIWGIISGVALLAALLQPVFKVKDSIERYSRLYTGHSDVYYDLHRLVTDISANHTLTDAMYGRFEAAMERFMNLVKDDDAVQDERLIAKCELAVKKEIPAQLLWMPS